MMKHLLILCLFFWSCSSWQPISMDAGQYRISDGQKESLAVEDIIAPYRAELEAEMDQVLTYSKINLDKGKPESTLTNWFVDVLHESVQKYYPEGADFTLQNYGGIRRSAIGAGPITKGLIYELMPFENRLVVLTVKGSQVRDMCNKIAQSGGWPVSSSLRFSIQDGRADEIMIGGVPLDENKTYRVALPDYVANGGDRLGLSKELPREDAQVLLRDALIEQVTLTDTIHHVLLDQRIKFVKE